MTERPIIFSGAMVRAILADRKTQTRRIVNLEQLRVRLPGAVRSDNCGVAELDRVVTPIIATAGRWRAQMHRAGAVSLHDGRLAGALGVKPGEFHFVCPYCDGDTHLGRYGEDDQRWTVIPEPGSRLWVKETFAIETNRGWGSAAEYPPPFNDGRPIDWHEDDEHGKWWRQCHYRATESSHDLCDPDEEDEKNIGWKPSIFMPRWASRIALDVAGVRIERLQDISEEDSLAEGVDAIPVSDVPRQAAWSHRQDFANIWDSINADRGPWASNPWVWRISFSRVVRS